MKYYFLIPLFFQKLVWVPVRLSLWFFCRLKVIGLENLEGLRAPVIFAPNHTHELDPALLPASLPFWSRFSPVIGASREKEFYASLGWRRHFYGRWFFIIWGGYPVFAGLRDYEKAVANHIRLINLESTLCIFPEGAKSYDGTIQHAKGGIAYMAERTDCPIIPVGISGMYGMTMMDFLLRRHSVVVHFGPALFQKDIKEAVPRKSPGDPSIYKDEANFVMEKVGELVG
jgi:1-acyl-sn-glycerol-3-phosphate acyltransferase